MEMNWIRRTRKHLEPVQQMKLRTETREELLNNNERGVNWMKSFQKRSRQ